MARKIPEYQQKLTKAYREGRLCNWRKPSLRQKKLLQESGGKTAPPGYHFEVEKGHVERD